MTVSPTVMPAIMSEINHSRLYFGNQVKMGIRLFTFSQRMKFIFLELRFQYSFIHGYPPFTFCKELKDYGIILDENNEVNGLDEAHQFSYSPSNPHWRVRVWIKKIKDRQDKVKISCYLPS